MTNRADPDQIPRFAASDQGLHRLSRPACSNILTVNMWDFQDACRDLLCDVSKILRNGSCVPAFSSSKGLCYKFFVKLTLLEEDEHTDGSETNPDAENVALLFQEEINQVASVYGVVELLARISFYKTKTNANEIIFVKAFFFMKEEVNDAAFFNKINDLYNVNAMRLPNDHRENSKKKRLTKHI